LLKAITPTFTPDFQFLIFTEMNRRNAEANYINELSRRDAEVNRRDLEASHINELSRRDAEANRRDAVANRDKCIVALVVFIVSIALVSLVVYNWHGSSSSQA